MKRKRKNKPRLSWKRIYAAFERQSWVWPITAPDNGHHEQLRGLRKAVNAEFRRVTGGADDR